MFSISYGAAVIYAPCMIECPDPVLEQVRVHLRGAYPAEGCGLLLGDRDSGRVFIREAHPVANLEEANRSDRFRLDPVGQKRAELHARERGLEVVGCYHSHPDGLARPSALDTARAMEIAGLVGSWIYLVAAVSAAGMVPRAFLLDARASAFREIPLGACPA